MNKNIAVIIGFVVLLVVASGVYASISKKNNAMMQKEKMEQQAMVDKGTVVDDEAMMKDDSVDEGIMMEDKNTSMMNTDDTTAKAGSYETYTSEKVTLASPTHDVVLFFRAAWCPTCRSLDKDIKENLNNIPSTLTILDVDYDNSDALQKKYGVTYQHTLVQVDKDGNLIKKWSGSPDLDALVSQVR